jgi:endoglucanase
MMGRITVIAVAGLVTAGAATAVATPAGAEAAGCQVDYTVPSEFPGGFFAQVKITNLGAPLNGWELGFDFTAGQRVSQGFGAVWSQSGAHVTAVSMPWDASLGTGASALNVMFYGARIDANPAPPAFTLNGVVCDGTISG